MNIQIEPINRQVVMQVVEDEGQQSFIIPEQIRKKQLATVVAAGPKVTQVTKGDVVAYRSQLSVDLELSGQKYLVCDEEALLCIVRREENDS